MQGFSKRFEFYTEEVKIKYLNYFEEAYIFEFISKKLLLLMMILII